MNVLFLLPFFLAAYMVYRVIEWDVQTDFEDWKAGRVIFHRKELWERIGKLWYAYFILSLSLILSLYWKGVIIWACIAIGFAVPCFTIGVPYMLFFDGWFNVIRGFDWWSNGKRENNPDRSVLDDFWAGMTDDLERFLKIAGSIVFITLYLYLLL